MTPTSCGHALSDSRSSRSSGLSLSILMAITSGTSSTSIPPPERLEQGPTALVGGLTRIRTLSPWALSEAALEDAA